MNPLSTHPPRTPRTSIITSNTTSHVYGQSIYEDKEGTEGAARPDAEEDEEEDEALKVAETRVRKEEVWRDLFLTSNGRDKAFVSLPPTKSCLTYLNLYLETNAIFYSPVSTLSHIGIYQPSTPTTDAFTMGSRSCETLAVNGIWPIFLKVLLCIHVPPVQASNKRA